MMYRTLPWIQRLLLVLFASALVLWQPSCSKDPCALKCESGQTTCDDLSTDVLECKLHPEKNCLTWIAKPCPGANNRCVQTDGTAACAEVEPVEDSGPADTVSPDNTVNCPNACEVGKAQCSGNAFEVCEAPSGPGCPAWGTRTECTPQQICKDGECIIKPPDCNDECTKDGEVRCNGKRVETCQKGQEGCLVWTLNQTCSANQVCENNKCTSNCTNACTLNAKKCSGNSVQTCIRDSGSGCLLFGNAKSCEKGQTCKDGKCEGQACNDVCTLGQSQCDKDGKLQTCEQDANKCLVWGAAKDCTSGQVCQNNKCETPACTNACTENATRCDSNGKLETCAKDAQGCLKWGGAKDCPTGEVCANDKCGPPACTNACTENATRCDSNGKLETCAKDTQGCLKWGAPADCPTGQTCTNGACTGQGCTNACTASQTRCDSNGKLETCEKDSNNFLIWGTAKDCPAGQSCTNDKCACPAPAACTEGTTRCDSNGKLETCEKDANGCPAWGTAKDCPTGQSCSNDKCACPTPAACTEGATRCDSNGKLETCAKGSNTCLAWGTAADCPTGQSCTNDKCACTDTSKTLCGGACVDTNTDAKHCGACNKACPSGQKCESGTCKADCGSTALKFSTDIWPIISANCGCHSGGGAGGLIMTQSAAYTNLFDKTSSCNGKKYVVANDPAASYLLDKINVAPGICGSGMPRTSPGSLPAADKTKIKNWICQGAPQ